MGIEQDRAVTFTNDAQDVAANYETVTSRPLTGAWKEPAEKDHNRREKVYLLRKMIENKIWIC